MDIEKLSRRALDDIKKLVTLPEKGTVAGGSLSNLIWEYVSGNKAIINDVDIFVLKQLTKDEIQILKDPSTSKKQFYRKMETKTYDTYSGLGLTKVVKESYYIDSVEYDGLLNTITYKSETTSPEIVIKSFDINCTQISYSIEEDKFYYSDDFVEFLETGKLKLTNLMSPCHSSIRLCKKEEDMNIKLDDIELRMLQYVLYRNFMDVNRRFFTTKYKDLFMKYQDKLLKYFIPQKETGIVNFMKNKNHDLPEDFELYQLSVTNNEFVDPEPKFGFDDSDYFSSTEEFLFFVRNIHNTKDALLIKYWNKLRPLFGRKDFVDCEPSESQLEILHGLSKTSTGYIQNMKGLKLSEQCRILDVILSKCDKTTAVRILNRCKINADQELDDDDIFLMEMLVRKEVNVKITSKVERVFGKGEDENVWSPF